MWGRKVSHHDAGTVDGVRIRAVVEPLERGVGIVLGPSRQRDCGVALGDEVEVVIAPEGPQREDLADDIAAALAAEPSAARFFDSLAQFYRTGYLRGSTGPRAVPTYGPSASPRWWTCSRWGVQGTAPSVKDKVRSRYATLGSEEAAKLDDGPMWPTMHALTEWTPAVEKKVVALVKAALS